MKKNWIPLGIAAIVILGIAAYFLLFNNTPKVVVPAQLTSSNSSTSSGSSSTSVSVEYSGFPVLTTHPTNPKIGYTYVNSTDRMIYSYVATNDWIRVGNIADNFIDEYSTSQEYYNVSASMAAVGTLRDSVWYLLDKAVNNPSIEIIDGEKFESTQGALTIRIPYDVVDGFGSFNRMPVYKVINAGVSLTLYLGESTFPIFIDPQIQPGSTLIPKRDDDNEWTYVKV